MKTGNRQDDDRPETQRQETVVAPGSLTRRRTANAQTTSGHPRPLYQATRLSRVIWEPIRARVLDAYEGRCCACGRSIAQAEQDSRPHGPGLWATQPQEANWHVHHRLPVVMGGGGARHADEFLLLCNLCHDRESARERRSLALRLSLFRARRILQTLTKGRHSRKLLQQTTAIPKASFDQTLRWLYRVGCIAGDAKSIGITMRGEAALHQLRVHCRLTPQEACVGSRPVRWFANGIWHPWLRVHLALLVATECDLLPPVAQAIALPCGETTDDPESSIRLATHLIGLIAMNGDSSQMPPPLDVALITRLHAELYALEEWCVGEIRYRRSSLIRTTEADSDEKLPPEQNPMHTRGVGNV